MNPLAFCSDMAEHGPAALILTVFTVGRSMRQPHSAHLRFPNGEVDWSQEPAPVRWLPSN